MDQRLNSIWWTLRLAFGLTAFLAGLDKFFGLLADWEEYLSPIARELPISPVLLMKTVGVVEIGVGLMILSGLTRIGAYIAAAWLLAVALNIVTTGQYFDVAVRDVVLALSAFSLARLTELRAAGYLDKSGATEDVRMASRASRLSENFGR